MIGDYRMFGRRISWVERTAGGSGTEAKQDMHKLPQTNITLYKKTDVWLRKRGKPATAVYRIQQHKCSRMTHSGDAGRQT